MNWKCAIAVDGSNGAAAPDGLTVACGIAAWRSVAARRVARRGDLAEL
jgi:hypothetical protein